MLKVAGGLQHLLPADDRCASSARSNRDARLSSLQVAKSSAPRRHCRSTACAKRSVAVFQASISAAASTRSHVCICVQGCYGCAGARSLLLPPHGHGEPLTPLSPGLSRHWHRGWMVQPQCALPCLQTHVDLIEKLLNYNTLERQPPQSAEQGQQQPLSVQQQSGQ
jgi:hypothetical protein